jgi:hypothetical protein
LAQKELLLLPLFWWCYGAAANSRVALETRGLLLLLLHHYRC